ncbi:MAG: hypothetical protein ABH821_04180 [archaeon]
MKPSIDTKTKLENVPNTTQEIHLVRPIAGKKLEEIIRKCRDLKTITLSESTLKRLKSNQLKLLKEKKIELKLTSLRGRPLSLKAEKLMKLIEARSYYDSYRKVESETGIPKSTAHYILNYSKRNKVKNNGLIVHVS